MSLFDGAPLVGLITAIAGGLLVGTERERHNSQLGQDVPIGVRTCTLTALAGAGAAVVGIPAFIVVGLAVVAFALASYSDSRAVDPGLTTEFSLLTTYLLAAMAMTHARLAAALFVLLTIILASKESLHHFSRQILSKSELDDGLLLAAAALIVLPLLPNRTIDPFHALNPRRLWLLVVWVMAINAVGYAGLRLFGLRRGLAFAGFFGGFVSSTATIGSMAQRAKANPVLMKACVAAALLSNVATLVQLGLIIAVVAPKFLINVVGLSIVAGGLMASGLSAFALLNARGLQPVEGSIPGRPFVFSQAVIFAGLVAVALLFSAALSRWAGTSGTYLAAATTGFADVHAASIAIGQLAANNAISNRAGLYALVIAFTANSALKCASASTGGSSYFRNLAGGIIAINGAMAAAALLVRPAP